MRFIRSILTILSLFVLAFSCKEEDIAPADSRGASLSLTIGLPKISVDTRAKSIYKVLDERAGKLVADPFGENLEGWEPYEKYIDGRAVYSVVVFLVDLVEHKLVGYREFYKGSPDMKGSVDAEGLNGWAKDEDDATTINVTFDFDHPLHGQYERLDRGEYQIIAVANYRPVDMVGKTLEGVPFSFRYDGLQNLHCEDEDYQDFTEIVTEIIKEYNDQAGTGTPKIFKDYKRYWPLMRYTNYAQDFLCGFKPQPLVLIQSFTLNPGWNQVTGQLHKTWARVRVVVENISRHELEIKDFHFSDNFARNKSFLMYDLNNPEGSLDDSVLNDDRDHTGVKVEYGAPDVHYEYDETKPFNAIVAAMDKNQGLKVPPLNGTGYNEENRIVLFDGYILDGGGQGNPFTYYVDLGYPNMKALGLTMDGDTVEEALFGNKIEDLDAFDDPKNIEGKLFAIQNQNTKKPFLELGNGVLVANLYNGGGDLASPISIIEGEKVFRFVACMDENSNTVKKVHLTENYNGVKDERDCPIYYIQSYDENYWFGTPKRNSALELKNNTVHEPTGFAVMIAHKDGHPERTYTGFRSMELNGSVNKYEYLNVYGPEKGFLVSGWDDNRGGSTFWMYKVKEYTRNAIFSGDVVLKTVDPETAVVSPVTAIHRNDFINILLSVSYDERGGDIKFEVKDWNAAVSDDDIIFE